MSGAIDRTRAFADIQQYCGSSAPQQTGLFLVNIARLRQLNLSLGYPLVDELLGQLQARLQGIVRDKGRVERIGNADYLLALKDLQNPGHARLAAMKMVNELGKPCDAGGRLHHLEVAVGVCFCPPATSEDFPAVLQALEQTLLEARQTPEGVAVLGSPDDVNPMQRTDWDIENELRQAIDRDQLRMYYQPQMELGSGAMCGAEALIRWRNGDKGFVRPDIFIPIAERSSLIEEITRWTLHTVLREMAQLETLGQVSINLSVQLLQPELVDDLRSALALWSIDPTRVVLEVTESAVISNLDRAIEILQDLRSLGVGLSIDDFGTGYSTMTYLRRLPASELKIDRSFVDNMIQYSMDEHIVKSLIHMAQGAGLRTVAEGVENEETQQRLTLLGCDCMQGYFLARPMSLDDLVEWLAQRPAAEVSASP